MCSLYRSTHLLSSKYNSTYNHYCPNNWQQKWAHPKWTCQNGPKCQYFVRAPLPSPSSTALILLGLEFSRAAQVVACILFHSSIMTSQSCWLLDTWCFSTFRLRMPHMCSMGFRGLETYLAAPSPSPSAAKQLSSRRRIWGGCYVGKQFLKGRHHLLIQNVTVHVGIHVSLNEPQLPSTSRSHAAPDMMLPPPCWTVGEAQLYWNSSPGHRHTCWTPSESNKFTLDSSDHRTWFQ